MTLLIIGLMVAAILAALFILARSNAAARQSIEHATAAAAPVQCPTEAPAAPPGPAALPANGMGPMAEDLPEDLPETLAELALPCARSLPPLWLQDLTSQLHRLPLPPLSLHKMVSPEFVERATSADLSGMVMGETLIAAKLLAVVNSPLYALRKPIDNIGQAVTFLGLNSARGICLRYLLEEPFKASSPQVQRALDTASTASAIASELCLGLGRKLGLPEPGSLVTMVVVSFLGHFAAICLLPRNVVAGLAHKGFVDRTHAELNLLGVGAGEIGRLLMQHWGLPAGLVEDVGDIDRIVVTPADAAQGQGDARLALCYVCARVGEVLARDPSCELAGYDPFAARDAEFHHVRGHFDAAARARLVDALHSPELCQAVQRIRVARHGSAALPTSAPDTRMFGAEIGDGLNCAAR